MKKKFFKWFNKATLEDTRVQVTKDYFSEDDAFYGDAKNGWEMLPDNFIELKVNKEKEK